MTPEELEALFALDAEPGPAKRGPEEADEAIVEIALATLRDEPKAVAAPPSRLMQGLAAGLVLGFVLAGGAAAALWRAGVFDPADEPGPPSAQAPAPRSIPSPHRTAQEPVVEEPAVEELVEEPAVEEPVEEPTVEEPAVEEPIAAPRPAPSSEDLLAAASQARGQRDYRRAARLYSRVATGRGPGAYAAAVAAAELQLEHLGHPAQASRLFRLARRLDPDGPLQGPIAAGLAACEEASR